jgi:RHH-type proline utilization regulon transcriptional repressor/proline dehydrogenase/delta 1-pyrroline-5-carboxylate dehydrogenase
MTMAEQAVSVEERTQEIARELLERAHREHHHLTTLNRWTKHVLAWSLSDPQLQAGVLRFIDCLPSLTTPQAVARHLHDYFPLHHLRLPAAFRLGVSLSRPGLLTAPAVSAVVHHIVEQVARQFIAGSHLHDAVNLIHRMADRGALVSFDVLGEQVTSDDEADTSVRKYATLINELSTACQRLHAPDAVGNRPLVHLSIKPSSLSAHFDPVSFEESIPEALSRLRVIAREAVNHDVAMTLDMEQYRLRDLTLELARRLLVEPGLGERLSLGIVLQAYLRDAPQVFGELLSWLRDHGRRLSVRLVKGAYWDSEVAYAKQRGWPLPVYQDKRQTDEAFERLTVQMLSHSDLVRPEIGSHNIRSIAHAMAVAESLGASKDAVEYQLLYGMGDAIQGAIRQLGYAVRVYTPLGELIPGMAYLVRRILENTANESFLRQDLVER